MILNFSKYHGTGNDFIMIDNRNSVIRNAELNADLIAQLCHRHFGISGDGLILINNSPTSDFEMVYFNSDGKQGSMCGNGGRCAVAFTDSLGLIKEKTIFTAIDGIHEATIIAKENGITRVKLKMQDVKNIERIDDAFIINTGSPHYISFMEDVEKLDVFNEGRKIRYNSTFMDHGINVDFAEVVNDTIFVRTYERGVEDETLSCGTGVTATALAACLSGFLSNDGYCQIRTLGGDLSVHYNRISDTSFSDIWLEGSAICVFKGEIKI
jgi:diaminopimelate epimerase